MTPPESVYGLLAEFETPEQVLEATRKAWQDGYRDMDAHTPYPVEGLAAHLGLRSSRVPFVVFVAGVVGAAVGYLMQYWSIGVDYPLNVGGRPINSWPAYLPVAFEVMILVAALGALLGMLFLNGLPQPYHPLFKVERFVEANSYRFYLCIEATDPHFDREATRRYLEGLHPAAVLEVPH